jgi:hypothetical protein
MVREAQAIINGIVHHAQTSDTPGSCSWLVGLASDVPKACQK